jgi:transposase
MAQRPDAKSRFLREHGTLNHRPLLVLDELFRDGEFFDPRDLVLVKYEMLRRVRLKEMTVTEAATAFGFSRPSFYQAQSLFQEGGLVGLIPQRPGPRQAHKLSPEILDYLQHQQAHGERLPASQLSQLVLEEFQLSVHPRSIERALQRRKKGGR